MKDPFDHKNLEGLFQSQLQDYEATPTRPLWAELENKIPPKRDAGITQLGSPMLLVLMLAIFGSLSFFFGYSPQSGNPAPPSSLMPVAPIATNIPLEERQSVSSPPAEEIKGGQARKKAPGQALEQTNPETRSTAEWKFQSTGKVDLPSEKEAPRRLFPESHNPGFSFAKKQDLRVEKVPALPFRVLYSTDSSFSAIAHRPDIRPAKNEGRIEWHIELTGSPYAVFAARSKKQGLRHRQYFSSGSPLIDYGILLRAKGLGGWDFEWGISYGVYQLTSSWNESMEFAYANSFLDDEDVLTKTHPLPRYSPLQETDLRIDVKYANIAPPFIKDGDPFLFSGRFTQRMNHWRLPFGVNYRFHRRGKLGYAIHTGFHLNFYTLRAGTFSNLATDHPSLLVIASESLDQMHKKNFQALECYLGLSAVFEFSPLIELRLAPTYQTSFYSTALNEDELRLTGIQLRLGLSYRLGRVDANHF